MLNDHRILWKEKVELCHVFALAAKFFASTPPSFFAVLRDDRSIRHEENEGAMQFPLSTVEQAPILVQKGSKRSNICAAEMLNSSLL